MENETKSYKEIQEKENQEVDKMPEEERELFYQFKEEFIDNLLKIVIKESKNEKDDKEEQEKSEERLKKALECIDFIKLYYTQKKSAEIKIYFEAILKNCSSNKEVHKLAYELNNEYKVLWDNLKQSVKDGFVKAWAMEKITNGVDKFRFGVATLGISTLIEKGIKNKEKEKYREYVTSDGFTNMCKDVNKFFEENKED